MSSVDPQINHCCPCKGVCHECDETLCDDCDMVQSTRALLDPGGDGDLTAFMAAERSMKTISELRALLDLPGTKVLWTNEQVRAIIGVEWDVLKKLMRQAGF